MNPVLERARLRGHADQLLVVGLVAVVWELFGRSSRGETADVPPLSVSLTRLAELMMDPAFWQVVGDTLANTGLGLLVTIVVGVPAGLLIGLSHKASLSTGSLIDFCRFLPAVALLPLVLLMFGATRTTVVCLVVISAIWPVIIQSIYAAQQSDSVLRQVSKTFHLSRADVWTSIYLPSATPFVFTGLRVAASMALLLSISAEFLGGAPGIGKMLQLALVNNQPATVFALVLVSGGLGLVLNAILHFIQRRLLWWHPSVRSVD